jgi:hypothetical protein
LHRHCVVVEAFGVPGTDEHGAEIGQTARLGVDALPARLDGNRAAAAETDIDVQPVFGRLALRQSLREGETGIWPLNLGASRSPRIWLSLGVRAHTAGAATGCPVWRLLSSCG